MRKDHAIPVEGCSYANPSHGVIHGGYILLSFLYIYSVKDYIFCGHQRHVAQCIELLQVGFCAGERNRKST